MESLSRRYGVDRERLRLALALFGAAALAVLVMAGARLAQGDPPAVAAISLVLLGVFAYLAFVRLSYEVELHDDGTLVFRSVLWTRRTHASRVARIRRGSWDRTTVAFEFAGGTARLSSRIEHLNDLVFRLRALNSGIEVERV